MRGILTGLTRGANRNHVVRAALESLAYQTADVLHIMEQDTGLTTASLAVDGGACSNDFLMQFQADIIDRSVIRPEIIESTSLGAAYLAGLGAGVWRDTQQLAALKSIESEFKPRMDAQQRASLLAGWQHAVRQCTHV